MAQEVKTAYTLIARTKGLMGKSEMPAGSALLLRPCNSIHTCFMRFNIDVAFLSNSWEVVGLLNHMRPWRFTKLYLNAVQAIELPAGTIKQTGTKLGDRLQIRNGG